MGHHACLRIRRHDCPGRRLASQIVSGGEFHRARMEGGNLIVVEIGRNKALRGQGSRRDDDAAHVNAQLVKPLEVIRSIFAHRRNGHWQAAQQLEVVSDVSGTPTVLPTHAGNEKRDTQRVDTIRKDVILEPTLKNSNRVERDGTTNQDWRRHTYLMGKIHELGNR